MQATTKPAQGRGVPPAPAAPAAPVAPGTPPAPPAPPAPRKTPAQNVRVDITITDTFGTGPTKKTVSLLLADGRPGSIRSSMSVPQSVASPAPQGIATTGMFTYVTISLNVDATPEVMPDGRIFLTMSVQYTPDSSAQEPGGAKKPGSLNEVLSVVLSDGKQTLLSQSADPQGDRKVTLEATASVVK